MKTSNLKFLKRYGKNLTQEASDGKLDTVIGRENEIERIVTVLSRRTKSNPVLIGEAGVGKTAIVEGLATRIAEKNVPGNLVGKQIYQVDLSSVVAGTKFRGEFEERIKGIIDEAVGDDSILLFIDEIHLLCGAGNSEGSMDAANILKPMLARNSLHLIGATTLDEYRKTIEKDKALSRRFQTVMVEEPSATITLRILKGIKKHYEDQMYIDDKKGVVVVYQPHQNTRQHEVQDLYYDAFIGAEKVFWLPTYLTREDESLPILKPMDFINGLNNAEVAEPAELDDNLWGQIKKYRDDNYLVILMTAGPADAWLRQKI